MASSQENAKVLVPFWQLVCHPRHQEQADDAADDAGNIFWLQYAKARIEVPNPPAVFKGVRSSKAKIEIIVPCLRNEQTIPKGARLLVAEELPDNLLREEESAQL